MIDIASIDMTGADIERRPPWESKPGHFLIQLQPSGLADPQGIQAASMTDAIRIARHVYKAHKNPAVYLRVTRHDNSEGYIGSL